MRELTPETITDAVLDQMATTPDPRLKATCACFGPDPAAIMKRFRSAQTAAA